MMAMTSQKLSIVWIKGTQSTHTMFGNLITGDYLEVYKFAKIYLKTMTQKFLGFRNQIYWKNKHEPCNLIYKDLKKMWLNREAHIRSTFLNQLFCIYNNVTYRYLVNCCWIQEMLRFKYLLCKCSKQKICNYTYTV